MPLRDFIRHHHEDIITEFAAFARTLTPRSDMSEAQLRDHAEEMLTAVVRDMGVAQSEDEQANKSRGSGTAHTMGASGRLHADARIQHGFTPSQLLAEFRALRATVLRLYELSGPDDLAGVRRFNESIDEALAESMTRYAMQTDLYRDQFIGILSHDLRNPLGAITARAGFLAVSARGDSRQASVASQIINSAQRMDRMIADLLDFTRTRLGSSIPLSRARTDLQKVCEEVILESRAGHPGIEVQFEWTGDLIGEWDADRLAQVVSNLVGNAVRYGDGTPVRLEARGSDATVVLSVHNHGSPIPADLRASLFEPLRRGADRPDAEGLGLGLFIARAVVTLHGGEIQVSSTEELGTTFTVVLPRT